MSLKTEYTYNEDDFIETTNGMQELTVTITLGEYRNLIKEITYQDGVIERLQEENKRLTEQNKTISAYIVSQKPEMIRNYINAVGCLFNKEVEQGETEQPETEQGETEQPETEQPETE